jgi:hypothetical protein
MQTVQLVAQLVDQAQQQAPAGGISADGWKVISVLCGAIGAMFLWVKALIAKIDAVQDARIADLKENATLVREDMKDGKIDGK